MKVGFSKFLKIIFITFLSIVSIVSIIFAFSMFMNYRTFLEENKLYKMSEFQDIKLGWSKDEVIFRKGKPVNILKRSSDDNYAILQYDLFEDKSNATKNPWERFFYKLNIVIREEKVAAIEVNCTIKQDYYKDKVRKINCNDNVDKLVSAYGEPKKIETSRDGLNRLYNYPEYNLSFQLAEASIIAISIYDPSYYPSGLQFNDRDDLNNPNEAIKKSDKDKFSPDEWLEKQKLKKRNIPPNDLINPDHCAPGLSRSERMKSLALKGNVRETGYHIYQAGSSMISFADSLSGDVISCY